MIPLLATVVTILGIWTLFWFERDDAPVSKAVWIPFTWLLIESSRPISSWLTFSGPGDAGNEYIDGSPLDRNVLTFILILGLFVLAKRTRHVRAILRANAPIVIYFLYCGISLLWADYPFVVFKRWIRSLADVEMVLIIITEPNWSDALKRVLTRIGFIVIPLSILFIRFYPSLGRSYSRGGVPAWTGVGTDKNALGMICMLFGTALLWRGLNTYRDCRNKYRRRRLVTICILFVMIMYLLLVVNSQTALACFMMASLLIILTDLDPAFRQPALLSFLMCGMLIVSFCVLFLGIGTSALSAMGRNATLTGRTDVWKTVLPYATNAWVGSGYENFWIGERFKLFERILGGLNQAHNGYIEIYLNIGWIGVILLSAVIVTGYRNILRGLRRDPEMSRLKVAFFLICLVYNFTEASFKMMCPVWMMFLWASMANPKRRSSNVRSTNTSYDESALVSSRLDA